MNRHFFALSVAASLAACSSSSATTAYVNATAETYCDQLLHCDRGQNAEERYAFTSEAECRARAETQLQSDFGVQEYIDDGSVHIDRGNLDRCLRELRANECVSSNRIPACRLVFEGRLVEGDGCASDVQCESGACSAAPAQCGTCLAIANAGDACDLLNDNCVDSVDGFVRCEPAGPGGSGLCVLQNESYLSVGLLQDCSNSGNVRRYCESPLYCDANDVCQERKPVGSSCDPDFDECAFGSTCADAGGTPTCLEVVVVTTAGSPCGTLPTGGYGRCDRGGRLYCDARDTDTCLVLAGDGGENSDCLVASDCKGSLVCVGSDAVDQAGTCETTNKPDATACESDLECASSHCAQPIGGGQSICSAPLVCN